MSEVFEQVMAQCARGSFTGLLRVTTREGNGEVRFLSGIQDGVRFDALSGDAALERLQAANDPEFEVIASLPPIDSGSQSPVPIEGGLDKLHAATLMRYCEANSLTCALEIEAGGKTLTARYRLGELLSTTGDLYRERVSFSPNRGERMDTFEEEIEVDVAPAAAASTTATTADPEDLDHSVLAVRVHEFKHRFPPPATTISATFPWGSKVPLKPVLHPAPDVLQACAHGKFVRDPLGP